MCLVLYSTCEHSKMFAINHRDGWYIIINYEGKYVHIILHFWETKCGFMMGVLLAKASLGHVVKRTYIASRGRYNQKNCIILPLLPPSIMTEIKNESARQEGDRSTT